MKGKKKEREREKLLFIKQYLPSRTFCFGGTGAVGRDQTQALDNHFMTRSRLLFICCYFWVLDLVFESVLMCTQTGLLLLTLLPLPSERRDYSPRPLARFRLHVVR